MSLCVQDICFAFLVLLMFWTSTLATIFMHTKAQGYLLLLFFFFFSIAKAESAISVDKSEFIISQGSHCHPFSNGSELWGQGTKKKEKKLLRN